MGGGLLQLVAYGAQDVYLTGNPQITFFKVVYRRHTNFALESIQQTFNGYVGYGQRVTTTISRNGDLISRAYLELESNDDNLVPYFGLRVLKEAEVEIGGQRIDKHYSEWLYIWNELTMPEGKKEAFFNMVGGSGVGRKFYTKKDNSFYITTGKSGTNESSTIKIIAKNAQNQVLPGDTTLEITPVEGIANSTDAKVTIINSSGYHSTNGVKLYLDLNQLSVFKDNTEGNSNPVSFVPINSQGVSGTPITLIGSDGTVVEEDLNNLISDNLMDVTAYFEESIPQKLKKMYIPLQFWFCNNFGLALPLIGLQYHEVKINIQFEEASKCLLHNETLIPSDLKASLWVDYVYLDTDERRKFAQSSHEYLIEQLQFTGKESISNKVKLNFNHPVKELIWVINKNNNNKSDEWFNFTNNFFNLKYDKTLANYDEVKSKLSVTRGAINPIESGKLILNGNDRFYERDGRYFNLVQPFQHHTNIPNNAGINVYSFALKPEEHQPSGSLNMSRIDTATLSLNYKQDVNPLNDNLSVYAVNYNVLRILSGMGGIAYSN